MNASGRRQADAARADLWQSPGVTPRRIGPVLLLLLVLLGACATTSPDCAPVRITEIPVQSSHGLLTTRIGLNGHWVRMLVDTGAQRSLITEEVAARLKLPRDPRFVTRAGGVGGVTSTPDARIDGMILGGIAFPLDRITVNQLGPGVPFDGLLGADVLLTLDLDLDVPNGTLSLYRVRRCAPADPPWGPTRPAEIAGVTAFQDRLMVPIEIDGVTAQAMLDTGAQTSSISRSFARRLGLTPEVLAMDPPLHVHGVGPGIMQARIHRFRTVRIGPVAGTDVRLAVMPTDLGFGDALIGQDFLRGRRLWASLPTRRLFISQHGNEMLLRE